MKIKSILRGVVCLILPTMFLWGTQDGQKLICETLSYIGGTLRIFGKFGDVFSSIIQIIISMIFGTLIYWIGKTITLDDSKDDPKQKIALHGRHKMIAQIRGIVGLEGFSCAAVAAIFTWMILDRTTFNPEPINGLIFAKTFIPNFFLGFSTLCAIGGIMLLFLADKDDGKVVVSITVISSLSFLFGYSQSFVGYKDFEKFGYHANMNDMERQTADEKMMRVILAHDGAEQKAALMIGLLKSPDISPDPEILEIGPGQRKDGINLICRRAENGKIITNLPPFPELDDLIKARACLLRQDEY